MLLTITVEVYQGAKIVPEQMCQGVVSYKQLSIYGYSDHYEVVVDTTKAKIVTTYSTDVKVCFKFANKKYSYTVANFGLGKKLSYQSKIDLTERFKEFLREV